ncbi:uncharacterized protein JCM15063_003529 [Sporobolomyces koalae]|uniref:uncharacterized protein n=1 Tax=Sporobolomyces koalae TaxID=500713 RepID=UPI003180339A
MQDTHSDTDSEYTPHSPTPAFPPSRPTGDIYSHLDAAGDDSSEELDSDCDSIVSGPSEGQTHKHIPDRVDSFVLLKKHKIDVAPQIRVAKWRSEKSGLKVIWAETPELITSLAITVVTEIFDSSGAPHTKEHLTFTSSKHYPYSNVLDTIANRLMTEDINASTDTDNTTYTVSSASAEGMLEIIPVYLDHIFFPLMTPDIFKTEIYHINGKGEEGGTVFSEMQGREGSQGDVMALAQQQALYQYQNAYRYETGGMLAHLRNLTLGQSTFPARLIMSKSRPDDLQQQSSHITTTTERDLVRTGLARGVHPPDWIRPFVESLTAEYDPIIEKDKTIVVPYADTDTSTGQVMISWVGPLARDFLDSAALGILGDYLAGSSHSILNRKFVEIPEPVCAAISFEVSFRDPTIITLILNSVKKEWLSTIATHLRLTLKMICRSNIDMKAMQLAIKNQMIALERTMETSPSAFVQAGALQEIIYGAENGSELGEFFNDAKMLKRLAKWSERDWTDLLKEYLVERHSVVLQGTPSPELVAEQARDAAARISNNKLKLGPNGLALAQAALDQAVESNKHPPPDSLVQSYPVPDVNHISWIFVDTARSNGVGQGKEHFTGKLQSIINADGPDLPFFVQFDEIPSSFVTISLFLHGPAYPILPLYLNTLFAMPVKTRDGRKLSWQEVSSRMDADLTSCSAGIEHEGIRISITALQEDYTKAISWLSDTLHGAEFDVQRLQTLVNSNVEMLPTLKQDGRGISSAAVESLCYSKASYETPSNAISLIQYYPQLKLRLDENPSSVVAELEKMRMCLLDARAMRGWVRGQISALKKPSSSWLQFFEPVPAFPLSQLSPIFRTRELLSPVGSSPRGDAIVYRIDNSESSYLTARARCPDWTHPDFAALDCATTLLSQSNGLLWQVTRTAGLCYGAWINSSVERGLLSLTIFRSPDALAALQAIRSLLQTVAEGKKAISLTDLEAAKSQIAYRAVADASTPSQAASSSFEDTVILKKPRGFSRKYLAYVQAVSVEDVHRVIDTWIAPLTNPHTSIVGAATSPSSKSALVAGLTQLGYQVVERKF